MCTALNYRTIILAALLSLAGRAYSQEYDCRVLSLSEGSAQAYIYTLVQDEKGCLWIGTSEGLAQYNGIAVRIFSTKDSLADNFITSAIADGGFLWFGHRNGKISFYDGKVFRTVKSGDSDQTPVTHFARDPGGQIWASKLSGALYKLKGGEIAGEIDPLKNNYPVLTFGFTEENIILVGSEKGLVTLDIGTTPGKPELRQVADFPGSRVSSICRAGDNSGYFIATENDGVFKLTADCSSFRAIRISDGPLSGLASIQSLSEDHKGNLWVGSFMSGLIRLTPLGGNNYHLSVFNKKSGFLTDNVKTVFEDREGNIWCGSYGEGLMLVVPKLFTLFEYDGKKYGNSVFSICLDREYLWLGTDRGLLKTDPSNGRVVSFYGNGSGLPADTVTALRSDGSGGLWIGTFANGLYRMNIESALVRKVQTGEGLLEKSVTAIEADKEGIWAGTKNGLCCIRTAAGGVRWYTISQGGLPHNNITDLFSDRTGRLWVATNSNTIASIYDGRVTRIPFNSGSGIKVVGSLTEDAGNRIWVGSRGNGVFVLSPDSAMHLTENEGLFSDFCYSVACDSSRSIWIGHKNGISRISTSDYSVKSFTKLPGVPDGFSLVNNAIVAGRNDMIYFGSDKGLIRFNSALDAAVPVPPVLGFTSVRINNEERSPDKSQLILPPGNYQLTVSFLGVNLIEPDHVIYHYKLDGYDEAARSTRSTSVTYGRLTQGKYVFRLSATNGEGIATESTLVLGIQIREPLWKQWWFWLSLAGAAGLIVFILIRLRLARLIAEKSILEEKVIERTSEIRRQKSEIESQRDMIEMKNINITSSISYASQIQQALLPPAEMLEKLLPDSFLFTRPRDIVSGDFYWLSEKDGKVIFTVADCTGHGVPGAFMSLLGITLLNEIVKVHGITKPNEILKSLYEKVNQSVLQNRTENITKDGMDIAVCALDKYKRNLQFSGGMHDLVHISDGNLSVLRADRSCISPIDTSQGIFSVKELDYKEADMIYLFSDGYQDQFGGEKNKKFLRSRFYNTLTQISTFPVSDQKEILETTLKWWMNGEPQTDDITVLGIRLH